MKVLCLLILVVLAGCKPQPASPHLEPSPTPEVITSPAPKPSPAKTSPPPKSEPFQVVRWNAAQLRALDMLRLDKAVALYDRSKNRYLAIEQMRKNGVPGPIIFTFHMRESGASFNAHLHNGDPLTKRTVNVPAGRIPGVPPPYTFEQSAEDALYKLKDLENPKKVDWRDMQSALQTMEKYNGLGYQSKGLVSPYLWAGTTIYEKGKYVRDHVFDPEAVDKQLGCAAILKRMKERGISISFDPEPTQL